MKILGILLLVSLSASCAVIDSTFLHFDSEEEAFQWISDNIEGVPDWVAYPGKLEVFQTPSETISLGRGDCDDFAILACSIILSHGWSDNPRIKCCYVPHYGAFHCYCAYDGKVFDPALEAGIVLEEDYLKDKISIWDIQYINLIEE